VVAVAVVISHPKSHSHFLDFFISFPFNTFQTKTQSARTPFCQTQTET
jgi:hypothetical protein